ncbi:MAG: hypothetical protein IT320_21975 [Anaerolineae bacterium]|nr:hypothetical protein [Anaerolineae bacterium]
MNTSTKTIVATYGSLEQAKKVIEALHAKNFSRDDIGLAVNPDTGEALLAVTTPEFALREGMEIVRQFAPIHFDERATGWRQHEHFEAVSPDVDDFMPVELAEKRNT